VDTYDKNKLAFETRYPQYKLSLYCNRQLPETDKKIAMDNAPLYINTSLQTVNKCRIAVFLGLYYGFEVLYYGLIHSVHRDTVKYLIIEHDKKQLERAFATHDLVNLINHPAITIILADDNLYKNLVDWMTAESRFYLIKSFQFFYNFDYYNANKAIYWDIANIYKKAVSSTLMHYGNDCYDSIIGVRNMLDNLDYIRNNPGINMLKDAFTGTPAICVSAGPSLNKNIKLLKGMETKAMIIACDAALQPLLRQGVKPHLVTSLERETVIKKLFENIKEDYSDCYFAGCPVIYKDVYDTYKGPKLIVYRQFDHFKWLKLERGMLPIKASPGNMNLTIAEYLGCDPIILIGQDLCIYGDETNVKDTPLGHSQKTYLDEPQWEVPGNYQDKVTTTRSLQVFLDSFNLDVPACKSKVINATEGGAKINGTELMTLQQAIDTHCNQVQSIGASIQYRIKDFVPEDIEFLQGRIKETINYFEYCIRLIDEVLLIENLVIEQIIEIKEKMASNHTAWQLYYAHIGQSLYISDEVKNNGYTNRIDMTDDQCKQQIINDAKVYFARAKGILQICINDLQGRL